MEKIEKTVFPSQSQAVNTNATGAKGFTTRSRSGNPDKGLIEALVNSKVFADYEKAFTEATGLPVALRPVETWQLPHHGKKNEGPYCAFMSQKSRACASCLQV